MNFNIIESLNSWILKVHEMPLSPMLEVIQQQFMAQYNEQHTITNIIIRPLLTSAKQKIKWLYHMHVTIVLFSYLILSLNAYQSNHLISQIYKIVYALAITNNYLKFHVYL